MYNIVAEKQCHVSEIYPGLQGVSQSKIEGGGGGEG